VASLLVAATPLSSSGDFATDLAAMIAAMPQTGTRSSFYLVTSPDVARGIAGLLGANGLAYPDVGPPGGMIGNWLPVLVSDALEPGIALMVDASGNPGRLRGSHPE
jgi:hypothetical protein